MKHTGSLLLVLVCLAMQWAGALDMMNTMEQCSVSREPVARKISLKLPIRQEEFHWKFMKKEELLAGKLLLTIERNGKKQQMTIFENGTFTEGWSSPEKFQSNVTQDPMVKPEEIYFLFKSEKRYETAPGDTVELTLTAKSDLEGIGPMCAGVLPKGEYKAKGTYSLLVDEYQVSPEIMKEVPKEMLDEFCKVMSETTSNTAFLENWQDQWDIKVTSEPGWLQLTPDQVKQMKDEREQLKQTGVISPFIFVP